MKNTYSLRSSAEVKENKMDRSTAKISSQEDDNLSGTTYSDTENDPVRKKRIINCCFRPLFSCNLLVKSYFLLDRQQATKHRKSHHGSDYTSCLIWGSGFLLAIHKDPEGTRNG
jgi:hypothetical protein